MTEPVILCIDDEPDVLRAVARDMRSRYGEEFRILTASSGKAAAEVLEKLRSERRALALIIADQRMPGMTGTEFMRTTLQNWPSTKRVLLTAYADTSVAIESINDLGLDYYLLKPWDPPELNLYPVVDDVLNAWRSEYIAPFSGLLFIDHRWNEKSHAFRDFLGRNHVPYRWLDAEDKLQVSEWINDDTKLPFVVFEDGETMEGADLDKLAEKLGKNTRPTADYCDVVVVGAGPAGLAAAVYAGSEGLSTMIVEPDAPGGQAGTSTRIENYLGFPSGLSGSDLARRALAQAERFGADIILRRKATSLSQVNGYHRITLDNGDMIDCRSVLLACGVQYRRLDAPGISELEGAGIYYGAAASEAELCKDQNVVIVGGGNSAGQAALFLAKHAKQVYLIVRNVTLANSMSKYLIERIEQVDNIEVCWHREIKSVNGEKNLQSVVLVDTHEDEEHELPATAMFIFIGAFPQTTWLPDDICREEQGFVLTGNDLLHSNRLKNWKLERRPYLTETSLPGVFAIGDLRYGSIKRVASAVGEGSMTIHFVHQYLNS